MLMSVTLQIMDDRVSSGDGRKVRFLQLNERVYALGAGLNGCTMQSDIGLQQSSAISDQQKIDELQHHHHHQQQQHLDHGEMSAPDRQVTISSPHDAMSFSMASFTATADGTFISQSRQKTQHEMA